MSGTGGLWSLLETAGAASPQGGNTLLWACGRGGDRIQIWEVPMGWINCGISCCCGVSTQLWSQLEFGGFPSNLIAQDVLQRHHIRSRAVLCARTGWRASLLKPPKPPATCGKRNRVLCISKVAPQDFAHLQRSLSLFTWRVSPPGVVSGLKKEQRASSEVVKGGIRVASGASVSGWTPALTWRLPFFSSVLVFLFLTSIREFLTSLFLR